MPRPEVEKWIADVQNPNMREVVLRLRSHILKATPDIDETVKAGNLFYVKDGKSICKVITGSDHIKVLFVNLELNDPDNLLKRQKGGYLIKIANANDIPANHLAKWVQESA